MKISVGHIIEAHLATLKDDGQKRYSREDILLFYLVPVIIGLAAYFWGVKFTLNVYEVSISVYSIFSGLLLNVQVALFGIMQREWHKGSDEILDSIKAAKAEERKDVLREVNSNISYLVLISCLAVTVFLLFYVFDLTQSLFALISIFIFSHFFLTLLMVIKRAHALFHKEYEM